MKITSGEPSQRRHFCEEKIGLLDRIFAKTEERRPSFNRRMFDEDFAKLFHYTNHRRKNIFEIVSNNEEILKWLLSNVKTRYSRHSIQETILDLIEEIARSLIGYGKAYYFIYEEDDDDEKKMIAIGALSPNRIFRLFNKYFQWLPKCTQRNWDKDDEEFPRELRMLDSKGIIRFHMPTSIKHMLSAQNRVLTVLDKHQFEATNFHPIATHENPSPTTYFDFSVWNQTQEWALYRATRETGWNGRKYDSSKRSDFFDCHRLIRFRKNQLFLRDNILCQLSSELSRIGKNYSAGFSVDISACDTLPSVAYLDELEVKLSREEVGFNEVIDYCFKP
ncbi:hypothetical protein [Kerstersia sp.]|uniref:hypothetical protein n=1 Tax=Kerstersia sp. TaxID=1930783 RepID=UPI003F93D383